MTTSEAVSKLPSNGVENAKPQKPLDIAIIGGGIGGLSLLLGIIQHTNPSSVRPHLYESAPAFSEIGAGVGFGPNSIQAMSIISPALSEAFNTIASDADITEVGDKKMAVWNEFRMGMDGKTERNTLKAGEVVTSVCFDSFKKNVHRATFLEEMIKLLPAREDEGYVSFRKRCVEIDDLGPGNGVKVHFEDGSAVEADAVIGCDGVKSRVRQILLTRTGDSEAIHPRFTGKYAYRGLIPMDEAVIAFGEAARRSSIISGYDGHLVCFPIDKGKTMNVVAFRTQPEGKWDRPEWVIPASIDQVLEDYKEWSKPVRDLLRGLRKPDIWALFEHPPAKSYCDEDGKICLLGDCAHASSPHQGAGAGMAIEDAAILSRLLGGVTGHDRDMLKSVFKAYDAVRRPRSQKLVTTSREAGELYEFQIENVLDDPTKVSSNLQERMKWIWYTDLGEDIDKALAMMSRKGEQP